MSLVSIVIPTYERPDFLRRLLDSVKNQTYSDFEIVIVDDASSCSHEYQTIVNQYRPNFSELRYLRNEKNLGAPRTRNRGINAARGEWIALVDDDDEWMPEKLSKQLKKVNVHERLGMIYTWTKVISDEKVLLELTPKDEGVPFPKILHECFIPSPSVLVRKEALLKAGLFDPSFPSCQDWDMWTRIFAKGYHCAVVPEFLTLYHKHNDRSIGNSPNADQGYILYEKKHLPLYKRYDKWQYFKKKIKNGIYGK